MQFADRTEAGELLAAELGAYRDDAPIVVGLTRGGVPVAAAVASALGAELDCLVVRKLGAPMQPELGLGAISENGGRWVDNRLAMLTGTTDAELDDIERRERAVMEARIARFRKVRPRIPVAGRTVIVVDDGIATGGTVRAALAALRAEGPGRLVLAVPVAAAQSLREIRKLADDVVCVQPREDLFSIGAWYVDFSQTSDDEVIALLQRSLEPAKPGRKPSAKPSRRLS